MSLFPFLKVVLIEDSPKMTPRVILDRKPRIAMRQGRRAPFPRAKAHGTHPFGPGGPLGRVPTVFLKLLSIVTLVLLHLAKEERERN